MKSTRRGNYESGSDYVLEYGELRFTFNERDFTERVEQAAVKLGFVDGQLEDTEREDLVNLAVNGHVENPSSALGDHVNTSWRELDGPSERSLVHWLRRLVFRGIGARIPESLLAQLRCVHEPLVPRLQSGQGFVRRQACRRECWVQLATDGR